MAKLGRREDGNTLIQGTSRPRSRRIQAVALDIGGVLYYDEPFELAWLQAVYERATAANPAVTTTQFTQRMRDFYLRPRPTGATPALFAPAGTDSWNEVRRRWSSLVQPIPGAIAALGEIADQFPVCVIANQPPEATTALHEMGVISHISLIALDTLVGFAKPDPRLFQWAFERFGWHSQGILMVGDRPDHDAAPALALGCRAALVAPGQGWQIPAGVKAPIVDAYQAIRAERRILRLRPVVHGCWRVRDLSALARRLGSGEPVTATPDQYGAVL